MNLDGRHRIALASLLAVLAAGTAAPAASDSPEPDAALLPAGTHDGPPETGAQWPWSDCNLFSHPLNPFVYCTLDTSGTAPEGWRPDYFVCHEEFQFVEAGGKPHFEIEFTAFCGVHPGNGLPGWTPVDWRPVTVRGRFNYETGSTEEVIWEGPDILVEAHMQCPDNPWAHRQSCPLTGPVVNNTGVDLTNSFPFSVFHMDHGLEQSLAGWEDWQSPEEMLEDWDPYGQSASPDMHVDSPQMHQVIPEGASSFTLDVAMLGDVDPPAQVEMQWQRVIPAPEVVGDLALPPDTEHWWEPFTGPPVAAWVDFPLEVPVDPGYFAGEPGLYEVRVRKASGGPWSGPLRFWVGDPTFDPPSAGRRITEEAASRLMRQRERLGDEAIRHVRPDAAPRLRVGTIAWARSRARRDVFHLRVGVSNEGSAAAEAGKHKLFVSCTPVATCDTLTEEQTIGEAIPAGGSTTVTIQNAIRTAAGQPRVHVGSRPLLRRVAVDTLSLRRPQD